MRRSLLWGIVGSLCLVSAPGLEFATGGEPVRDTARVPVPVRRKNLERREAVEKLLDQPLEWDLGDRKQATLKEFIAFVREERGLAIRWDAATFQMLSGQGESLFGGLLPHRHRGAIVSAPLSGGCPPGGVCAAPAGLPPATFAAPAIVYGSAPSLESLPVPFDPARSVVPAPVSEPATRTALKEPAVLPIELQPLKPAASPATAPAALPAAPGEEQPISPPPLAADSPPKPAGPAPGPDAKPDKGKSDEGEIPLHEQFAEISIPLSALSLEDATVEEGLRQMLDAVMPPIGSMGEDFGVPIVTRAMTLDYLIEGRSVLITTHLRANAAKETRVYRIGHLKGLSPEGVARVITHTVRPWSWRTQATEIAERLAARWPKGNLLTLPIAQFEGLEVMDGIRLTTGQGGESGVKPASAQASSAPANTEEAVAAAGQLLAGGAVATVQSIVAALEIVHHGDPPTGVIEVLPGVLVVTQSQGAHREIADLLSELGDAAQVEEKW